MQKQENITVEPSRNIRYEKCKNKEYSRLDDG